MMKWKLVFVCYLCFLSTTPHAQEIFFADGYHGGVYGHYPSNYTQFILETLNNNPDWKINLEIEPETWDSVLVNDTEAFNQLKEIIKDQTATARIEYVNPSYGQSYLFNISGESIIRQFQYGIKKLHQHFPGAKFTTYSSEEPCFTTALPQVLRSLGFTGAVLKNPNTCWGGYTRNHNGELVNWVGPDGTIIPTVPRYEIEALADSSTWQTIAYTNSPEYISAAKNYGIQHPVGMTLQDAGWKNGPWLGAKQRLPSTYITWRNYFENIAIKNPTENWRVSQEDIQVSLVWGSQVMQRLAREVRLAENKIVMAEKIASVYKLLKENAYPTSVIDEGWRGLMLAQHHDCWIVPYNGRTGNTWADKVTRWTGYTVQSADSIMLNALDNKTSVDLQGVILFNTLSLSRNEIVEWKLPENVSGNWVVTDNKNKTVQSHVLKSDRGAYIIFAAKVPPLGFSTYHFKSVSDVTKPVKTAGDKNGVYIIETDMYKVSIDAKNGGILKNLYSKKLNKEFSVSGKYKLNELRGYFKQEGGFRSSTETPATVSIIEDDALRTKIQIDGFIASHPFTQVLTFEQEEPVIKVNLKINWKSNTGIGDDFQPDSLYKGTDRRKAFYNDTFKLLALFPVNVDHQKVFKDAPMDVTESALTNTFFSRWDSIKNNIIFNWVDVYDEKNNSGFALFTDHTTSYVHGENYPLALNVQFSGRGLWGRNYSITQPTELNYAIMPHDGNWSQASLNNVAAALNEPVIVSPIYDKNLPENWSLLIPENEQWQVTSITFEDNDLLVRFYNAGNEISIKKKVWLNFKAEKVDWIELNGTIKKNIPVIKSGKGKQYIELELPPFTFSTLRFSDAVKE